jgi:cell division protein FtsB/DNA-directed RNA polymerase subunit RPC12/RpoP
MGRPIELVALRCPRCGADLRVSPELDIATCNYCGGQVAVVEKALPDALGADVAKKRAAIDLLQKELAEHESELSRLNKEIEALVESAENLKDDRFMIVMMLAGAGVFFDLFLFPMFYFLDVTHNFGMSRVTCLALGMTLLILFLAGMAAAWTGRKRAIARRREEILRSSEYQMKLQKRQALEEEIRKIRAGVDAAEEELRQMLHSIGQTG